MNYKALLWMVAFFLLPVLVSAANHEYHLKLLAVQEVGSGYEGSDADLFLELKEGSGRVFLETFPLTKMDTQISTRFAKEIACKHFKLPCNQYDFIYTIRAQSNIIGGPSAGAAIAALTAIAMLDLKYREDIAITGTINSGAIIGPVGGIKEKLEAASRAGIKKVLIAKGSGLQTESLDGKNETLDLVEYGRKSLGLQVIEVTDLDEVITELTGVQLNTQVPNLVEDPRYNTIMRGLRQSLCERTAKIHQEINKRDVAIDDALADFLQQQEGKVENATRQGDFYAAASFCFNTNIKLKTFYYEQEGSKSSFAALFSALEQKIKSTEKNVREQKIETISDLQTVMIVEERVNDVKEQIKTFKNQESIYSVKEAAALLAYAEERFYSAQSWVQFFAMDGKQFIVDKELLQNSCMQKISEAEERFQYTSLFLGESYVRRIGEQIETARQAYHNGEYELCLITAAQAKASSNAILSSLGVDQRNLNTFLAGKKAATQRVIAENSAEGIFPILGYSYYQYAVSLQSQEPFTALVYYEDALEMSDLSIYFPEKQPYLTTVKQPLALPEKWRYALGGMIIGVLAGLGIFWLYRLPTRKKKKK